MSGIYPWAPDSKVRSCAGRKRSASGGVQDAFSPPCRWFVCERASPCRLGTYLRQVRWPQRRFSPRCKRPGVSGIYPWAPDSKVRSCAGRKRSASGGVQDAFSPPCRWFVCERASPCRLGTYLRQVRWPQRRFSPRCKRPGVSGIYPWAPDSKVRSCSGCKRSASGGVQDAFLPSCRWFVCERASPCRLGTHLRQVAGERPATLLQVVFAAGAVAAAERGAAASGGNEGFRRSGT